MSWSLVFVDDTYFCVVDDDLDEEGIMDEEEGDEEDFEGEEDVSVICMHEQNH
jgi:hypothetical protein